MTPAQRVAAALHALWYGDGPVPAPLRDAADTLLAAGVLDPWPWRREGVRAELAGTLPAPAPAPPRPVRAGVRAGGRPLAITVLPHHPGVPAQPWWRERHHGVRFEIAELPPTLPPDLRAVPDEALDALAAPHLAAAPDADPLSPVWAQGEAGLRWQVVFRRLGSPRPFVHVPHANPVVGDLPLAALAAARTRRPGDTILAGSSSAAAGWRRLGFAADPHFPFGVDVARLTAPPAAIARARAALGAAPALLYTGRLDADKGLFALLDAFASLRAVRPASLVLAWRGGHPTLARLVRDRAAEVGGVRIVEDPPPALYAALHGACAAAVTAATSPFETFGRSPAEALSVGLPLVAPAWGPLRDLLAQAPSGAAFPVRIRDDAGPARADAVALAEALHAALDAAETPREPGAAAALRAALSPSARFQHAVALSRAAVAAASRPPVAIPLPAAWEGLDAALGHPDPTALRSATWPVPGTRPALAAAREAIRAAWFAAW